MPRPAGRLIAIEGGEGAGKSTQAARLADAIGAELTREPGGTAFGEQVRALLLDPAASALDARAELLLMLAARAQHLAERIVPALDAGRNVVVDRFSGSTIAYQGHGRGLPIPDVRRACELATTGRWPDLTVLIDVPFGVGAARRHGGPDRIEAETAAFHERVRQGFLSQAAADRRNWSIIDGSGEPDAIAAAVLAAVRERLSFGAEVPSQ